MILWWGNEFFLKRPTAFVGPKIQSSCPGPYQIVEKFGKHSFVIQVTPKSMQEVNTSQIKICVTHLTTRSLYPIVLRRGDAFLSTPAGVDRDLL